MPVWVYADENVERDSPLMAGEFVRNVFLLAFRENTPQAVRQRIVDGVGGRVVGGRRIANGDGFYAVLIGDDGTAGPLLRAIGRLDVMPEVWLARREFVRSGVSIR